MEVGFKLFGHSSWRLIMFMVELVEVVFFVWWLWLFRTSSCCWFSILSGFCCSYGRLLLKAAVYVLLVLYLLLMLLFSSWSGRLNFSDKFRVCFSGIFSPYFSWRYFHVSFLLSCWIVSSWFLLICSLIVLYSVGGRFDWSFESISFISCSVSLIVASQNFIVIFVSCFAH